MNQLRKDYILDKWVIIARERAKRPSDFIQREKTKDSAKLCFFCPGNEKTTPPEIERVEEDGRWIIRCFPNKYPATTEKKDCIEEGPSANMAAYGRHEVIVETPEHDRELGDLDVKHISRVLLMYSRRLVELKSMEGIEYVSIFKNRGKKAGASLAHSHTQLIALPLIPQIIKEEMTNLIDEEGKCRLCQSISSELKSKRAILEDEHTAVFAPYASRSPFEVRIIPKRHVSSLENLDKKEMKSLASSLKKTLEALNKSLQYPPYNYHLHLGPGDRDFHMYLELIPRLSTWAGFELGNDIIINTMPPENAAEHYREQINQ